MADKRNRWIARIRPPTGSTVDGLLGLPFPLDAWESEENVLAVAADEEQLFELERRRIAQVEWLCTVAGYVQAAGAVNAQTNIQLGARTA